MIAFAIESGIFKDPDVLAQDILAEVMNERIGQFCVKVR